MEVILGKDKNCQKIRKNGKILSLFMHHKMVHKWCIKGTKRDSRKKIENYLIINGLVIIYIEIENETIIKMVHKWCIKRDKKGRET